MADGDGGSSRGDGQAGKKDRNTERVILKRERVLVLPESVPPGKTIDAGKLADALGIPKAEAQRLVNTDEAWIVVGRETADTKARAIAAYAGEPGTPDAKPGAYKAPTASAWRGGENYVKPPEPKVERLPLDD